MSPVYATPILGRKFLYACATVITVPQHSKFIVTAINTHRSIYTAYEEIISFYFSALQSFLCEIKINLNER